MSKIIFVVFVFYKSWITILILLNKFDFNNSRNKDGEKKNEIFLFFKKLIFGIEKAQKSQQSNLKLNENNVVNIDNNNSFYCKNDNSIFEQDEKYCFFNILRIFITDLKIEYDF